MKWVYRINFTRLLKGCILNLTTRWIFKQIKELFILTTMLRCMQDSAVELGYTDIQNSESKTFERDSELNILCTNYQRLNSYRLHKLSSTGFNFHCTNYATELDIHAAQTKNDWTRYPLHKLSMTELDI